MVDIPWSYNEALSTASGLIAVQMYVWAPPIVEDLDVIENIDAREISYFVDALAAAFF